ncbi:hemagglutinin [Nonlabens ulvanivorans]|uniref:Peptidoglycan hydrolase n=1 Tax=Nonlabens ulvanivorans TaxID=906888 RepID=A0A090WD64_NONUL|nr:glucosaminidase domain-containing protein [Nonlabens ulvanivorans]GAL74906.1 hemagglutinin [Nonlabens ulvanivorans]
MKFKSILYIALISLFIASCGSNKKVVTTKKRDKTSKTRNDNQADEPQKTVVTKDEEKVTETIKPRSGDKVANYVNEFKGVAMKEMHLYKIPASITLAQGILESGSGFGRLSVEANNHFGIKCHTAWTGERIYHDDDEDQECFRKYVSPDYSYRDHSLFLTQRKRYASLFKLDKDDYKGWAYGLRKAGYATDKKYPQKLISLIERYELYQYDAIVLGNPVKTYTETTTSTDKTESHIVKSGDTLYGIAKKYNITVAQLKTYNSLKSTTLSIGQVLIVKPISKDF